MSEECAFEAASLRLEAHHLPAGSVLPDYREQGVLNLARSFGRFLGGEPWSTAAPASAAVGDADVVVFLLVDGLGDDFLLRHGAGSRLLADRVAQITSVFPSTTASAVTTMLTALAPRTHGLNGWHIRDESVGGILAPLPLQLRSGEKLTVDAALLGHLFPYDTIFQHRQRESIALLPAYIARSPFSVRHYRGSAVHAYRSLDDLVAQIVGAARTLKRRGGGFIHAYYPELDALSHQHGCESTQVLEIFQCIDQAYQRIHQQLAGQEVALVVSADHGFIDAPFEQLIRLDGVPNVLSMLESPLWGERRASFCEVREGAESDFMAWAETDLHGIGRAVPSDALLQAGFFGAGPGQDHAGLRERIGSHAILMEHGWTICDPLPDEHVHEMLGVHGGLSRAEMLVPLITARAG